MSSVASSGDRAVDTAIRTHYVPPRSMHETPWVLQPTISMLESFDVTLLLGAEKQPVRASTMILGLASRIWKTMFGGHWKESSQREVEFPGDDVRAMLIVLRIAHLRFDGLPELLELSFTELFNLAIVCDKYEVVHLVLPFLDARLWAIPYKYPNYKEEVYPSWLFIAWTFGYTESFVELASHLVCEVEVREDGVYLKDDNHDLLHETHMPPGIIEGILDSREKMITQILDICYEMLDKVMEGPKCLSDFTGADGEDQSRCSSMILGSFLSQLVALELYPSRKTSKDLRCSVRTLAEALNSIKLDTMITYDIDHASRVIKTLSYRPENRSVHRKRAILECTRDHSSCGKEYELRKFDKDFLSQVPSPVSEAHMRHMADQAGK